MTVLPWLLLYATVIQLGQSNYSILSEDGTYEVNSYANNTLPFIDRSQIRRTRRSVDSDVENAQKTLDQAGETLKKISKEIEQDEQKLKDLEEDLKKAQKFANERKEEFKDVSDRDTQLKNKIAEAEKALPDAETAYKTTKNAYDKKKESWDKDEDAKRLAAETTYNNTKKAKTTADDELVTATGKASEMKKLMEKYDMEEKKEKDYNDAIAIYDKNFVFETTIKTENKNIANNKLRDNVREAEKLKSDEDKKLIAIEKNGILNGDIKEDFSTKTLEGIEIAKQTAIGKLNDDLKTKKDTPEGKLIEEEINKEQSILNDVQYVMGLDPTYKDKTVADLRNDYNNMKAAVQTSVAAAATAVTRARGELEKAEKAIETAQAELNKLIAQGTTMDALRKAKEDADAALPTVKGNIRTYTVDLDNFSTANGGQKGPAEWVKLKTKLDGDVTAKTQAVNTAILNESTALTDYTAKKKTADENWDKIKKNEKKIMDDKRKVKEELEKDRKTAQTQKDALHDYYEKTEGKYNASLASVENVTELIEKQNALIDYKRKNDEYNALKAQDEASKALKTAQDKKAEADKQAEEAKKQAEEAAAEARRKDQEHQEQVRALGLGFGVTAGIVVIGAAVGLSVFFVMRRRRKQKKEAAAKVPKREEIDAPNGLTIIRREGMQDKYVIKGDDFNFRGPLVRGRVHNEVPTKHMLDDQVGGDKIENIFFDKKLNDAYLIGEGVEIIEEDSVSVSEGKKTARIDPVELLANMSAEDMAGSSQKYIKDTDAKAAPPGGDKKSSKSKRAQTATPKKAGAPSDDKKA